METKEFKRLRVFIRQLVEMRTINVIILQDLQENYNDAYKEWEDRYKNKKDKDLVRCYI